MILNDVKALAARVGVTLNAACTRAGMAYSTPHRWGKGAKPDEDNVRRLRAAIIVLAHERGSLPGDLAGELKAARALVPDEVTNPHDIVSGIEQDLKRLRRSLRANGVAATS